MKTDYMLTAAVLAAWIAISLSSAANAQGMGTQSGVSMHDMMGIQSDANSGMQMSSEAPCADAMNGRMRSEMMGQGMRSRMMGPGMMQGGRGPGMDALFGARVERMLNLTADDVRSYLDFRLERLKNKRLKIGDIKLEDGAAIADIVTVDNSLVQRLKVDRHTGAIEYID
jgi:hypothetical protein